VARFLWSPNPDWTVAFVLEAFWDSLHCWLIQYIVAKNMFASQ
jgi:hypothetical protein